MGYKNFKTLAKKHASYTITVDPRNEFKRLRKAVNLTQSQLAYYLEVDQSLISKFEKGRHNLKLSQVEKACELFGVSVGDVLIRGNAQPILFNNYRGVSNDMLSAIAQVNVAALNIKEMEKIKDGV